VGAAVSSFFCARVNTKSGNARIKAYPELLILRILLAAYWQQVTAISPLATQKETAARLVGRTAVSEGC
jgi:hypothetical protein